MTIFVILPIKSQAEGLRLRPQMPKAEIVAADDGSIDSAAVSAGFGAKVQSSPRSTEMAQSSGAVREVKSDILAFMDGDGQHGPARI